MNRHVQFVDGFQWCAKSLKGYFRQSIKNSTADKNLDPDQLERLFRDYFGQASAADLCDYLNTDEASESLLTSGRRIGLTLEEQALALKLLAEESKASAEYHAKIDRICDENESRILDSLTGSGPHSIDHVAFVGVNILCISGSGWPVIKIIEDDIHAAACHRYLVRSNRVFSSFEEWETAMGPFPRWTPLF